MCSLNPFLLLLSIYFLVHVQESGENGNLALEILVGLGGEALLAILEMR